MVGARVEVTGIGRALSYLSGVSKRFGKALDETPRQGAEMAHKHIRRKIVSGAVSPPLAPATVQRRQVGKAAGLRPAEPSAPGARPWFQTGNLYNSIMMRKVNKGVYTVFVAARPVPGASGLNTAMLAERLETGYSVSIPVTLGMLRYLAILFERGTGKKGGRARQNVDSRQRTGKRIVVKVPPRPVFSTAVKELQPEIVKLAGRSVRMILGA